MEIITLYRYVRTDGGTTVSPNKPDTEYTELVRLVADEGKMLTKNGEDLYLVIDQENADGWYEVDEPVREEEAMSFSRRAR